MEYKWLRPSIIWNKHELWSALLIFYTKWKHFWGPHGPRIRFSVSIFCIILLGLIKLLVGDHWDFVFRNGKVDILNATCGLRMTDPIIVLPTIIDYSTSDYNSMDRPDYGPRTKSRWILLWPRLCQKKTSLQRIPSTYL